MNHNDKHFYIRAFAVTCLVIGIIIIGVTAFRNSMKDSKPMVFADSALLSGVWDGYKETYWESGTGRTLDKQQNNITTSEGQSYTMMRAVWMDDQATFDKAWTWTKQQLRHSNDAVFAWRWGQKTDGSYGVLTDQGGQNSAADADIDIAYALLMAANRWQNPTYRAEATTTILSIWEEEVSVIQGKPYLFGNDLEKKSQSATAIVNPSYYAPYAFREFAKVDTAHDWTGLVDSTYTTLSSAMSSPLNTTTSANLPPDWVYVNKSTGELTAPTVSTLTTNFSYDAIRTVWRVSLDYQWNKDKRAKALLAKMSFLADSYNKDGKLYSTYSHAGKTLVTDEVPAMYGATLGYFLIQKPDMSETIYVDKLKSMYNPATNRWKQPMSYYSDNWAWFGMALANEKLINYADNEQATNSN